MVIFVGEVHLETEEDAWEFLRSLVDGDATVTEIPRLQVGSWAKIDVYISENKYDSAITPYMMKGWVELQRSIYRSYSLAVGRDANGASLTDREKDDLELIVEVKSGSSDQAVDIQAIIEKFLTAMVGKMEPQHILIAAVTLILTWGGKSVVQSWLAARKEVKIAEIEAMKNKTSAAAHIAALSTIAEVAGVTRERVQLISRAMDEVPVLQNIEAEADKGREALIRHVTKDDAVVNGVPIGSAAGQSITSRTRVEASDVSLDGLYKIRKVDTTMATGFRVHISDAQGKELVGDVAEVMTTLDDRKVIQEAEWEKAAVFLRIAAKVRRGVITDATILQARKHDPETDGAWRD